MVPLNLTACLLLIIALPDAKSMKPTCNSTCVSDQTKVGNRVSYYCQILYTGGNKPALTWKWKLFETEVINVPRQEQMGNIIKRSFVLDVKQPVPELFCTDGQGEKCNIASCNILHKPKLVVTIPLLFASPGETITCTSDGNPKPESFKWQEKVGDTWIYVPGANEETITPELKNGTTSTELRCEAMNSEGSEHSVPLIVTEGGAAIRTKIIIGVVVGLVVLGIAVGVAYFFLK